MPAKKYHTDEDRRQARCAQSRKYASSTSGKVKRVQMETARVRRRQRASPRYNLQKWLRRKYGISLVQYDTLLADQHFQCAICARPNPTHVDHDHSKKKGDNDFVRGILCRNCNIGAGHFHDDPALMMKAALWYAP